MPSLTVAAELPQLERVQSFLAKTVQVFGCSDATAWKVSLIAEEIFVNIASYAYRGQEGEVTVFCRQEERGVRLTFLDSGEPFDPTGAAEPDITLPADVRRVGGLGILLTRKMAEDIHYRYRDGKNCLELLVE